MIIIELIGKSGSGKTTGALYLHEKLANSVVTNYAKFIKMIAKEVLDISDINADKPRKFLQDTGNLMRDTFGTDFLVNRIKEDIIIYDKLGIKYTIIADARMQDEVLKLKEEYKVITIKLLNDSHNELTGDEKKHNTETIIDTYEDSLFDYIIDAKNINDYHKELDKVVEDLK